MKRLFVVLYLSGLLNVWAADNPCVLDKVPQSVYGTSPITTYFLLSLVPDKVAGLNFPQDAAGRGILAERVFHLPIIGGWFGQGRTPNKETLLTVNPDLVLMSEARHTTSATKQRDMLTQLKLPVCQFSLDGLQDYPAAYRMVGQWLGVSERGQQLADFSQHMIDTLAQARQIIQQPVRVYYAQGNDGLSSECRGSLHAEVIELAGAVNPHQCEVTSGFGMVKVSLEQVLNENPDYILTQDSATYRHITTDHRWQSVPAVKQGKVLMMPGIPWRWMDRPPSFTRLIAAPWLMHQLYPQVYPAEQLKTDMQHFFTLFFNYPLEDASLDRLLLTQGGAQ